MWVPDGEDPYTGEYPIVLSQNDYFSFFLHDYTKELVSPQLKVVFEPFPAGGNASPFDAQVTAFLRTGVPAATEYQGPDYNSFAYGPYPLVNTGVEFEFSLEIDDNSRPPHRYYVDPQMIVEGSGG
jgi:hypothetical protein